MQRDHTGRFPPNDIISLLSVNRRFNLAESTSLDLELGEVMDFVNLESLRALKLGYAVNAVSDELRRIVGKICKVPTDWIVTTHGTSMGLYLTSLELCRPGDEVVLVTPCFPPTRDALYGLEVNVKESQLSFDRGYEFFAEEISRLLSERTRLVSIASPMNPSGIRVKREQVSILLKRMSEIAPQAVLFVDETFREATYGERPADESLAGFSERIITASSCSKALGAPGLRLGWLTLPKRSLRERIQTAKMNTIISESVVSEALAIGLLKHKEDVLGRKQMMLRSALDSLSLWHDQHSEYVDWIKPEAGAICCFRLKDRYTKSAVDDFWARLPNYELQLAPGNWFGESSRIFRLGFGYLEPHTFELALGMLSKALKDH